MEAVLETVEADALSLNVYERAALAQRLLASLDQDDGVERAWDAEVERRIAEIDSGAVQMIPINEALAHLRAGHK